MKTTIVKLTAALLFSLLLLNSCKKESTQISSSAKNANKINDLQVGNNSSCKVMHIVWGYWYTWDFHYSDKGLADEWKIDLGNGYVLNFKMKYDKFDKLVEAAGYDDFNNIIFTSSFTYSGNRVISQKWADLLSGANGEVLFSHNSKGQIVREDDIITDVHSFLSYDNMGNSTRSDLYIGSDLYYSDIYEFNITVRNPLLTVSGVDFMFPFSGVPYFNKLWFSRNLTIIYDSDGNPYIINDLDASKTDFSTGYQHFPISINYYDKVSESPFDFTFGYSCNGNSDFANHASPQGNRNIRTNKITRYPGPMLLTGSAKSIKEQLQELRKQYGK